MRGYYHAQKYCSNIVKILPNIAAIFSATLQQRKNVRFHYIQVLTLLRYTQINIVINKS